MSKAIGGFSMGFNMYRWIRLNLPKDSTILELGSGAVSELLDLDYKLISVEHDPAYVNKYHNNYIYAPIKDGWYDVKDLPDYDLLIIDGPTGKIGREGVLDNLHLFNLSKPIIVDDIGRSKEMMIAKKLEEVTGRTMKDYKDQHEKRFCIV